LFGDDGHGLWPGGLQIDPHQRETFCKDGPTYKKLIISDQRDFAREQEALNSGFVNSARQETLDGRGIRIPSPKSLRRRIGAAACTITSTTTSDSSARVKTKTELLTLN
jgi:hypothetical protein